jgi:putative transposase
MFPFILDLAAVVRVFFVSRSNLAVEILALRQQVSVLKRKRQRPKLNRTDRLFWIVLRRLWSHWAEALLIVKPETVVGWHRTGFRLYWRRRSRGPAGGRVKISLELRELIQRMARENPTWGAPKIHGELLKLGLLLSERSVSRYLRAVQRRGDPGKRWLAFLHNHREAIVALDFFTVPTVSFQVLYCLFVIEHARRRILHFHVTPHPNSDWSSSSCGRRFLRPPRTAMQSWIGTASSTRKFWARCDPWACSPSALAGRPPGRMEWRNDGWEAAAASCWTM